jgi:hypothetical protein
LNDLDTSVGVGPHPLFEPFAAPIGRARLEDQDGTLEGQASQTCRKRADGLFEQIPSIEGIDDYG